MRSGWPGFFVALLLLAACVSETPQSTLTPTPETTPTAKASPMLGASPATTPTATPTATASPTPLTAEPTAVFSPAAGRTLAEVARVIDGDTIAVVIDGVEYRVRYIGIDTPETVHPSKAVECYGREASQRNRELVEGKTVELEKDVSETDQYGRLLRYVWVDGEMVNAILVEEGYAAVVTYPPDVKYQELFLELQRQAREKGRGLWSACLTPTVCPPEGPFCDYSGTCEPVIKGNISTRTGERIYHVPGGEFYDSTVIDEAAGERWFCTEQEAVEAGWRRSKR
ncbi:MAG: thermonuclease family protein [Dehalococcoidia bacterium]